eukprot:gene32252-62421_t
MVVSQGVSVPSEGSPVSSPSKSQIGQPRRQPSSASHPSGLNAGWG